MTGLPEKCTFSFDFWNKYLIFDVSQVKPFGIFFINTFDVRYDMLRGMNWLLWKSPPKCDCHDIISPQIE